MKIKIISNVIIDGRVVSPGSEQARQIEQNDFDDAQGQNLIRIGCACRISDPDKDSVNLTDLIQAAELAIEQDRVTKDGLPEVKAMEEILGYDITAAQRDQAFEALKVEE